MTPELCVPGTAGRSDSDTHTKEQYNHFPIQVAQTSLHIALKQNESRLNVNLKQRQSSQQCA